MRSFLVILLLFALVQPTAAHDTAGCKYHPLITRYPGAMLAWCEEQNHVAYAIAHGPITGYRAIDDRNPHAGIANGVYHLALLHNGHISTEPLELTR